MKRTIALRYALEMARRVHHINGILATPLCRREAVRFKRIWVFGSVAKGSDEPNDLDILIEYKECGRIYNYKQTKTDKRYLRRYGRRTPPDSLNEARKWLTKGMKKVSRHSTDTETIPIDVKILLYPRNDLIE